MRYDTPIYFQKISQGDYDASTGNYGVDIVKETERLADISGVDTNALSLIYGNIKQDAVVIRLQNHYNEPFDRIRIGKKVFCVDFSRKLHTKHVFVASEVQ